MRFVAVKSEAQQTRATLFRTLGLLGRQRIQLTNASRGPLADHGAELGTVSPKEAANLKRLIHVTRDENDDLPGVVRELGPYSLSPSGGDLSAANGDIPGQSGLCSPAPPRPKSAFNGDRQRLERPSQMGPRDTEQLLIIGALAVVRGAARYGARERFWLARMLWRPRWPPKGCAVCRP